MCSVLTGMAGMMSKMEKDIHIVAGYSSLELYPLFFEGEPKRPKDSGAQLRLMSVNIALVSSETLNTSRLTKSVEYLMNLPGREQLWVVCALTRFGTSL